MSGETILILTNDAAVGRLNRAALELAGYRVMESVDLAQAQNMLSQAQGFLLDKNFPRDITQNKSNESNIGVQFSQDLRRQGVTAPIIMISGDGLGNPDPANLDAFLPKPYVANQLIQAFDDAFKTKQTGQGPTSGDVAPGKPVPRYMDMQLGDRRESDSQGRF